MAGVTDPPDGPAEAPSCPPGPPSPGRPGARPPSPGPAGAGAVPPHAAVQFSAVSFASALAAFVLIGAIGAGYGPLLRTVSERFGVSVPEAGTLISIHFCGALAGVAALLAVRLRVPGRLTATAGLGVLAAGCLVIASARAWPQLAAGALGTGLGFGVTDFGMNDLVARTRRGGRAGRLTALNAAFGAGAVAGPVLVALLGSAALPAGFAGAAVIAGTAALGMRGLRAPACRPPRVAARDVARDRAARRCLRIAAPFGLAYLCYVGCESGIAGWIPAYLSGLGRSAHLASATTSAFWGALTAGRLCLIPLSWAVPPRRIVLAAALALLVCVGLTAIPAIAPAAFAATGLAAAPIFPAGLAWAAGSSPCGRRSVAWALTWSMAGGVAGPGAVAAVTAATSVDAVPAVLAVLAAAAGTGFLMVPAARRPRLPVGPRLSR